MPGLSHRHTDKHKDPKTLVDFRVLWIYNIVRSFDIVGILEHGFQ